MTNPMDWMPLGDYEAFRNWSGQPRSWGPERAEWVAWDGGKIVDGPRKPGWKAWFGGKVVDGLCDELDQHMAAQRHPDSFPAAIGCVPWLTSEAVVDRLLKMACCVVLDKGAYLPARLVHSRLGFPNSAHPYLEEMTPAVDGDAMVVGPYTPREEMEHDLGPVRLLGWDGQASGKPLLHAKLLILGELSDVSYPDAPGLYCKRRFVAQRVWLGSANWTDRSRSHLEVGFLCDDPPLVARATGFVTQVISFSEPVGTTCVGPEPNLVHVQYDEEAFNDAADLDSYCEDDDDDD